jgi:hypothetical protein
MSFKCTSDLGMYIQTMFLIHHFLLTSLCGKALFEIRALNHNAARNGYFLINGRLSIYLHRYNTVRYQTTGATRRWDSGMETADQNIGVP